MQSKNKKKSISFDQFKEEILNDYRVAFTSRECSIIGRREVLTGKASFGIFGDGKELPQIAMAKFFKKGDFRSGYYRDQTFMFSLDEVTPQQFFAGLYAHTDLKHDPMSAGRQMGSSFATHSLDENYDWKDLTKQFNSSADLAPTGSQMPRLLGLAQASKIYKNLKVTGSEKFTDNGNEIAWGTIGDASTSEGHFFESINAAGVMQIPMIVSVWDDNYGISVPSEYQTTKGDISEVLKGFKKEKNSNGFEIFKVKKIKGVVGFSMGAQQAFQWAVSYPDFVEKIVGIAGSAVEYPHGIVRLEGFISAIKADASFANGQYMSPPEVGLRAGGAHWASWGWSQEWYRLGLYEEMGLKDTDEVINWFEEFVLSWDANNLIALARTWQNNNIGNTPGFNGNYSEALGSIKADVLYMPSETDMYFHIDALTREANMIPGVKLRVIPPLWGHIAGAGFTSEDIEFMNNEIIEFYK